MSDFTPGETYDLTVKRRGASREQTYERAVYVERAGGQRVFLLDGSVVLRVDEELLVSDE